MSNIPFWIKDPKGEAAAWEYLNENAGWIMVDEIVSWYNNLSLPKRKKVAKTTYTYFMHARNEANSFKMRLAEYFDIHNEEGIGSLKELVKAGNGLDCMKDLNFLSDLTYYYLTEDSWHPLTYVILAHFANTTVQQVVTMFRLDNEPTPNPRRQPYEVENFGISLQLYISDLSYNIKARMIRAVFNRLAITGKLSGDAVCKNLASVFKKKEAVAEYGYNKTLDLLRALYVRVVNDNKNIDDMTIKYKDHDHMYDIIKFMMFIAIGHLGRLYREIGFDNSRSVDFAEHNKELDIYLGYHNPEDECDCELEAALVNDAAAMSKAEEDLILSRLAHMESWKTVHEQAMNCRCPDCTQEDFYFHD